jgi:bacillithiol biosynthesis deacetylase BshB1
MGTTLKLDVLAIGAHPDDIELTCAGTLVGLSRHGRNVGIVDLTAGELGTRGSRETRLDEARKAATIMGVARRDNLGLTDGNITINEENILKVITSIRTYRPEILLFPYSVDRHPDHEHAHQLCKEAWFYSGLDKIKTLVDGQAQEPHRPRKFYHFMQWYEFTPSFIVDVTDAFDTRMEAIRSFRSQFHDPESTERETVLSDPKFLETLLTRARYYGDRIGTRYGEPFFSPQIPGIRDLCDIL